MKTILIDKIEYKVSNEEFEPYTHPEYNNLQLYTQLAELERVLGLLLDMQSTFKANITLSPYTSVSFGGFLKKQINQVDNYPFQIYCSLEQDDISTENDFEYVLCVYPLNNNYISLEWKLNDYSLYLNIRIDHTELFNLKYHWHIDGNMLTFDNLIHLVMIVKNAGSGFREILEKNIPYIDRWTILDTGSTDDTVKIIQETLSPKVRGELYQEPFIDFGTSRNRVLELAGQVCKYALMLDDTYYIEGDLRGFLNEARSDQFADSFSLYITSNDVQYVSNRLLKTKRNLKYIFKIHEVVQDKNNINVIVPITRAKIHDKQSDYMQTRTNNRKTLDLELLHQSIQEEPDNPRHLYYMAQTYVGMKNYEMAYRYFLARVYHPVDGFLQEKIDACFEAARTAQFQLNRPWTEVKPLYEKAYEMDPTRPDSVYFLGVKEYLEKNRKSAYELFKKAFEIGYPLHAQYSLKPTLSYHFTPKFLVNSLCWDFEDYKLGEDAAKLYIKHNPRDEVIESWFSIYNKLRLLPKITLPVQLPKKPYFCFVADGNWNNWTGRDLIEKGLGGSETYIVEMASHIQEFGEYNVVVFCKCSVEEVYNGVEYKDLSKYYEFITRNVVQHCVVSRFSEYLPVTYKSQVENVYLVVHDLTPTGTVLIRDPKLKAIFTLTEWHNSYLENIFPTMSDLMVPLYYGIHSEKFRVKDKPLRQRIFTSPRFIYSSFPNRGLLIILEMWKDILRIFPDSTLDVYSRLDHPWCLEHYPQQMIQIQNLIHQPGIITHGWVNQSVLTEAWKEADIWLYPCIFQETFCHTALQAAASQTLAITSDLAALRNTVGDRGFMIPGDPHTQGWRDDVLNILRNLHTFDLKDLLTRNLEWAQSHSWENQAKKLLSYADKYKLEYRNMFNWTNNIPLGSQELLIKIVKQILGTTICARILEIGTYTGTGLIHLLRLLPNSSAVVIDSWKNYDEFTEMEQLNIQESFIRNIQTEGLMDRVEIFKSESRTKLIELIRDHANGFHLIMVDGSHYALDTFADLVLAWELLLPNGLMIIDDYQLESKHVKIDYKCPSEFAVPREAVDRFVKLTGKKAKIIFKDYRMYLQKQ
jgi:predicted O-methyltransferase YrrM